MQITQ